MLAEQLTIDPADIEITYSDTDQGLNSTGPGGSRFTVMVTGAIVGAATRIREKMFRIAAHLMEADVRDLALEDEVFGPVNHSHPAAPELFTDSVPRVWADVDRGIA